MWERRTANAASAPIQKPREVADCPRAFRSCPPNLEAVVVPAIERHMCQDAIGCTVTPGEPVQTQARCGRRAPLPTRSDEEATERARDPASAKSRRPGLSWEARAIHPSRSCEPPPPHIRWLREIPPLQQGNGVREARTGTSWSRGRETTPRSDIGNSQRPSVQRREHSAPLNGGQTIPIPLLVSRSSSG